MTAGRSQFVTPEAVTLTRDLAGVGSRLIATLLDTLILFVVGALLLVVAATASDVAGMGGVLLIAGLAFFIFLGYYVLFEGLWDGQTPGKRAQHIRVVSDDGRPLTMSAVLVRNLVRIVDVLPGMYAVGMIAIFVSTQEKRLGDVAAGTVVVHERDDAAPGTIETGTVPGWAHTVDVSGVGDADYALARSFLRRRYEVDRQAAVQLAEEVAGRLRELVPGIPQNVPDSRVIEGVVAAVRERS